MAVLSPATSPHMRADPLATRLRAPRGRAARPAIQHLDPAAARRRRRPTLARRPSSPCGCRTGSSSTGSGPSTPAASRTLLSELAGKPVRLELSRAHARAARRSAVVWRQRTCSSGGAATPHRHGVNGHPRAHASRPRWAATARTQRHTPLPSRSRLNPALTFDTLVPGRANQMARTAALHVAGAPGQHVQPALHLRRGRAWARRT